MSVEFHDVQFHLGDYDILEVDFALLPGESPHHASRGTVEQTIRCELLDFISTYPSVTIHALLLSHEDDMDEPRSIDHNCKLTLPIGITTFLKPLPLVNQQHLRTESDVFEELWARHNPTLFWFDIWSNPRSDITRSRSNLGSMLPVARPRRPKGAGWTQNPKGPQITPFCHQMGRHPTIWDMKTGIRRRIPDRISPWGSWGPNPKLCSSILDSPK